MQNKHCDDTNDIGLIVNNGNKQSLQNGVATHSVATLLFSMRAVSLALSQCWLCIDADVWCKRVLTTYGQFGQFFAMLVDDSDVSWFLEPLSCSQE